MGKESYGIQVSVCVSLWYLLRVLFIHCFSSVGVGILAPDLFFQAEYIEVFVIIISPFLRGVGCIFVEMIQGVAAFPGMKDIQDQLERIFLVSSSWNAFEKNWFLIHPLVVVENNFKQIYWCHI